MFACILIRSRSDHIVNPCLKLTRVLDPWLSDLIKSGCGRWKLFQISRWFLSRFLNWSLLEILILKCYQHQFYGLNWNIYTFHKATLDHFKKTRHNLPSYWMGHRQFVWKQIELNQLSYQADSNQLWNYPPHRAYFAFDFRWRSILF